MLTSVIGAYMLANFSDNVFDYGSLNWYFWGFLGVVFAKWAQQRSESSVSSSPLLSRYDVSGLKAPVRGLHG